VTVAKGEYFERELGLTDAEWKLMIVIGAYSPLSTKTLAMHTSFDKAKVSRTTERLIWKQLVRSRPNPEDQRLVILELTARGRKTCDWIVQAVERWDAALLECLSPTQIRQLVQTVEALRAQVNIITPRFGTDRKSRQSRTVRSIHGRKRMISTNARASTGDPDGPLRPVR